MLPAKGHQWILLGTHESGLVVWEVCRKPKDMRNSIVCDVGAFSVSDLVAGTTRTGGRGIVKNISAPQGEIVEKSSNTVTTKEGRRIEGNHHGHRKGS